jgi:hypothetical protein
VAVLIALHRLEQLRFHLGKALENGVKKEELIEVITPLAFYAGGPNAMSAIMVTKEGFSKALSKRQNRVFASARQDCGNEPTRYDRVDQLDSRVCAARRCLRIAHPWLARESCVTNE